MSKKAHILVSVILAVMMMPIVTLSGTALGKSADAPKILTAELPKAYEGQPYYFALEASGDGPITWSVSSSLSSKPLPPSLTYDVNTGVILGVFDWHITKPETLYVIVIAKNSAGRDEKHFVLEMLPATGIEFEYPPGAPKITTAELPNPVAGQNYSFTFSAVGDEPINWAVACFFGNIPSTNPSYFIMDAKTGILSNKPSSELKVSPFLYKIIVFAMNSKGMDVKTFILEVQPPPEAEPVIPDNGEGVQVNGRVQSYNPHNPATVALMQGGEKIYSTTIEAADGSGSVNQAFIFDSVKPGIYDLVVTKKAHLNYTVTDVIVGADGVDLTQNPDPKINLIALPCGDINGDGFINSSDLTVIIVPANYDKPVTAAGVNPLADLVGAGFVNSSSISVIILPANYDKKHVVYPYS